VALGGAIPDPRGRQGRQWPLGALLNGLFIGRLAGGRTLERVERLTDQLSGGWRRSFDIAGRIADTTRYDFVGQLDGKSFRPLLHAQIKRNGVASACWPMRCRSGWRPSTQDAGHR